jgi:hypothetical protein
MRSFLRSLILAAFFLLPPALALGQATQSFSPTALPASLSVSNSSSRVVLPSPGPTALIINTGSNAAYLAFGSSSVTATTSGYLLSPGCSVAFNVSGQTYVAAITASSTTTLKITTGSGLPTLSPNACLQTVTVTAGTITTVTTVGTITNPVGVKGSDGSAITSTSNPFPTTATPLATSASGVAPVVSSAVETSHVIKAGAGNLYSFNVSADSTLAAAQWEVLIFNATSAPAAGAVTPVKCYIVPAGGTSISGAFPTPLYLGTGISITVSTATTCFTQTDSAHAFISGDAK